MGADTVGRDSDNDDLPDEYEANEGCFYKTMDWVKGNQVQPSVIEADMAGLPGFDSFKDDINSCSAWSGNFGGRKKRDLGSEDEELEEVPSVMESGNGPLQWVRSLVRNVRSAEPDKENKRKAKKGKSKGKGKKGRGRKADKGKGKKKGKKNGNKNNSARKGGNKGKEKERNKKKGGKGNKGRNNQKKGRSDKKNGEKGGKKNEKKGRSGKDSKLLPEFLYNQLWCFDLAMEQALERCV